MPTAPKPGPSDGGKPTAKPSKPTLYLPGPSSDHAQFHDGLSAILASTGEWFEFGGQLVQTAILNREFRLIRHSPSSIIPALERHVQFLKWRFDSPQGIPSTLPVAAARTLAESLAFAAACPHIRLCAEYEMPFPDPEQQIAFTARGYNPECQVFQPSTAIVPVEFSTAEAGAHWEEMCADFPFASLADTANFLAILLTPYLRLLFAGPSPLFVILANSPRAGKDCLIALVHITFIGRTSDISLGGYQSEEDAKAFASLALAGNRLIHAPNIVGRLKSTWFERLITERNFSGRILGSSATFSIPNEFLLSMSGNSDFTLGGDLAPRTIVIRLHLDVADPNARAFRRPDPYDWAARNRFATLGMLRRFLLDWLSAGMPAPAGRFASFPQWFSTVAGVAQHALGESLDVASTSLQADPRVAGLAHVLDVLNNPLHEDREHAPAGLPLNPRSWTVGDLRTLTAALQKHDPQLLDDFPLNAIEFNQAQSAAVRFGLFVHARNGVPTGPFLFSCLNPDARAQRRAYRLDPIP
jgi:hypothetical protein